MEHPYLLILRRENVPALGCTEPAAAALAVAKAREVLGRSVETLRLWASGNVLKNAMGVGIPGTRQYGLRTAAALALAGGRSRDGLEVLRDVTDGQRAAAQRLLCSGVIQIELDPRPEPLYIRAECYGGGESAAAVILREHSRFHRVERNGASILEPRSSGEETDCGPECGALELPEIWRFIQSVPAGALAFLERGIEMNRAVAEEGLRHRYGLGVGRALYAKAAKSQDPAALSTARAAAAADARMAGCPLPVMSTAGSGNQGIATILPVVFYAEQLGAETDRVLHAVALSQLVTLYAKQYTGRLSCLCAAANAAAMGTACAVVYLRGGGVDAAERAIQNVAADTAGIICDGAKSGCALKLATGLRSAFLAADLAMDGICASGFEGIVHQDAGETIRGIGRLCKEGMCSADPVILRMMLENQAAL